MATFTLAQKNGLSLISDTDQNMLHPCKHKNLCKIQFFRIQFKATTKSGF